MNNTNNTDVVIRTLKKPKLKNPVMVVGFPGVGFVGKLAVDHLIDELQPIKFTELYSQYFPPEVMVNEDGTIRFPKNEFYYWKNKKGKNDVILVTGDFQGITGDSQYKISKKIVEIARELQVTRVYTLGGLGTGQIPDKPKIYGAATQIEIVEELKKKEVAFRDSGGIFGAAGLVVGFCKVANIQGVCLMGETHGQILDARAAESLLLLLTNLIGIEVDMKRLDEKVKQTEAEMKDILDMIESQRKAMEDAERQKKEFEKTPLGYIR